MILQKVSEFCEKNKAKQKQNKRNIKICWVTKRYFRVARYVYFILKLHLFKWQWTIIQCEVQSRIWEKKCVRNNAKHFVEYELFLSLKEIAYNLHHGTTHWYQADTGRSCRDTEDGQSQGGWCRSQGGPAVQSHSQCGGQHTFVSLKIYTCAVIHNKT